MKALITGINGFVGSHLAELLLSKGHDVYGTILRGTSTENIKAILDRVKLIEADICERGSVESAIGESSPDHIYHLAAAASVADSFNDPLKTLNTNISGSLNLFEAVRALRIQPVILAAGSAEVYGDVQKNKLPTKEDTIFAPLNPYAASKAAVEMFAYQYFRNFGLKIIRTRAFNHIGPRQSESFVVSSFARQVAAIEKEISKPVIMVGNLEPKRDFTFVGDVVAAYQMLVEKGTSGEAYNICSGKATSIKEVLDMLLSFSKVQISVKQDKERMRPSDIMVSIGDPSKIKKTVGWKPSSSIRDSLLSSLEYWRAKLSQGPAR